MGQNRSADDTRVQEVMNNQVQEENQVAEIVQENESPVEEVNNATDNSESESSQDESTEDNPFQTIHSRPIQKSGFNLCCVIKAKTREHDNRPESKKSIWFEGKLGGVLKIGTSVECGLQLKDDRSEKTHALIRCRKREENGIMFSDLVIYPCARMYRLTSPQEKNRISMGSVIKLGSISFAVINIAASDGSKFNSENSFLQPYLLNIFDTEEGFLVDRSVKPKKEIKNISQEEPQSEEETEKETEKEKMGDCICYICWNSLDLTQHKIINEKENEVIDFSQTNSAETLSTELENLRISTDKSQKKEEDLVAVAEGAVEANAETENNEENNYNPMIINPCGKCAGSSQYVHFKCLMKWIKSSKSGHCSICNGVLPYEFSSKPPNIELKLIRHRRGQRWVGNRRFRLSFAKTNSQSIGSSTRCDVTLPDVSVSDHHANIFFDREKREFYVKDCNSKGGTYLQLTEPLVLNEVTEEYQLRRTQQGTHPILVPPGIGFNEFKMGRTTLSIKVVKSKDKKSTLHKLLQKRPPLESIYRPEFER